MPGLSGNYGGGGEAIILLGGPDQSLVCQADICWPMSGNQPISDRCLGERHGWEHIIDLFKQDILEGALVVHWSWCSHKELLGTPSTGKL